MGSRGFRERRIPGIAVSLPWLGYLVKNGGPYLSNEGYTLSRMGDFVKVIAQSGNLDH